MLKITSLAIALLTVMSIAPQSQAATTNVNSLVQPASSQEHYARIFIKTGEKAKHHRYHHKHHGGIHYYMPEWSDEEYRNHRYHDGIHRIR